MKCKYCHLPCIRKGIRNNIQQYYCKRCEKYQRSSYSRISVTEEQQQLLIQLNNEGVGVRSIGRILKVPASSIVQHTIKLAGKCVVPEITERGEVYEIDELQTYIGKNEPENYIWIAYAINRETKKVVHFVIGRRTKANLQKLTDKISGLCPKYIYTDGLNIYRSLIDATIHKTQRFKINYIERKNLTLRTHLKRLNRRSICFSKSEDMLYACLMIYFFGYC